MADNTSVTTPAPDFKKLETFVEAALTNPKHPVYQLGMTHSPILQHYAVNVQLLTATTPEQWFKDYPDYTTKLREVMALCEEQDAPPAQAAASADDTAALKAEFEKLKTELGELKAKIAEE